MTPFDFKTNEELIGKEIRSYDFPGRKDCFVEGVVTGYDKSRDLLTLKVTRRIFEDKVDTDYPSFAYFPGIFGYTNFNIFGEENERLSFVK